MTVLGWVLVGDGTGLSWEGRLDLTLRAGNLSAKLASARGAWTGDTITEEEGALGDEAFAALVQCVGDAAKLAELQERLEKVRALAHAGAPRAALLTLLDEEPG